MWDTLVLKATRLDTNWTVQVWKLPSVDEQYRVNLVNEQTYERTPVYYSDKLDDACAEAWRILNRKENAVLKLGTATRTIPLNEEDR